MNSKWQELESLLIAGGIELIRTGGMLIVIIGSVLLVGCNPECGNKKSQLPTTGSYSIFERGGLLPPEIVTGKAWHKRLVIEDTVLTTAVGNEEFEAGS
jgi:hypothetical protein